MTKFEDTDHNLTVTVYQKWSLWFMSNGDFKSPFVVSWAVKHGIPGKLEPNFTPYLK